MAITKEITVKVKVEGGGSIKKLDKEVKDVDKSVKETGKGFSGLSGTIDKFTGGAISKFKAFTSGLGGVAGGFKGIGIAIAASGIGLIVLGIAAVTAAFKNSEAGQNKFAKLMGVIGSVVGNLVDILASVGEKIIWAFENPKKAINDFVKLIKENIINRFNGLLELIPALGKAVKQLFTLDFSGAAETAANAVAKVVLGTSNLTQSISDASAALKGMAKEIADDAKKAAEIADKRARADKIERNLIVQRAKADRDIAELRFKSEQRDVFSVEERIGFLKEASKISEDIATKEIQANNLRLSAKIEENKLSGSNKDALNEVAELTAKGIQLETAKLTLQKSLQASLTSFQNEELAGIKVISDAKKKQLEDDEKAKIKKAEDDAKTEEERLSNINKIREEFRLKNQDLEDTTELEKIEREQERAEAELERLNATEAQKAEVRAFYAQLIADEEASIAEKAAQEERDREAVLAQFRVDIRENTFDLIRNIAKRGSAVAKGLAITEIVREQVASISSTISATALANAKAAAASPLTLGQPFVTLNTLAAGTGIAASAAGAARSISDILSDKKSARGGSVRGGGGGGGASAPSFNLVAGSGTNQIAEGLANQPTPIRAFVVSSEVTNAQSLDRNIEGNSSVFG